MVDERLGRNSSFIDNLDKNTQKKIHPYRIEGLSEDLTTILLKAKLDERDSRKALELALKEVFFITN